VNFGLSIHRSWYIKTRFSDHTPGTRRILEIIFLFAHILNHHIVVSCVSVNKGGGGERSRRCLQFFFWDCIKRGKNVFLCSMPRDVANVTK
jgi:hypothetical protein